MKASGGTGFLDSGSFDAHHQAAGHPERPERLLAVREGIAARGTLEQRLHRMRPRPVERALLEKVHTPTYVREVETLCRAGGGRLDADTAVVEASWVAATKAAGAVAQAVEEVVTGRWQRAFCAVRPPGHHAPSDRAMGFCLFDNVAVGAEKARMLGLGRVAILDWDVHHGNGTQDIFWERGDVLYASWHQYPFYPGTGAADEIGAGAGLGTTVNCPLPAGSGDAAYLQAWEERIRPALEDFGPELVLISAGFDADERDPLGGLVVTSRGFAALTEKVRRWSDTYCAGRLVSVLEGGYDLEALREDVPLHVEGLL